MNVIQTEGLGAAWLIATVGHTRKLSKKDITSVSIPQACGLVQRQKLLRLALNLMYGLALIYKQQVNYMFEDVANVHQKLARPVFFGHVEEKKVVQRKHVPLQDSTSFTMRDFACDEWFLERQGFRDFDECLEDYVSHAQRADAFDKLLDEILEQSMATIRANDTTLGEAGFEFDKNGEINSETVLAIDHDLANLDIDFGDQQREEGQRRDHTNDPHFSTTLNPFRSTVDQRATRQKRKHVAVDPVTTHTGYSFCYQLYLREFHTLAQPCKRKKPPLWEILSQMSLSSAHLVNYARQLYLEPPPGTISQSRLPHYKDRTDDVEIGRNVQILADAIEFARALMLDFEPEDTFESFTLEDKYLEEASFQFPSSQVESQGPVGRNLHKLALKLLGYIQKRSLEYGSFCDWEGNEAFSSGFRKVRFVDLFPPVPLGSSDLPVSRNLAAKSFGTVLELATKKALHIVQGDQPTAETAWVLYSYDSGDHNVYANVA